MDSECKRLTSASGRIAPASARVWALDQLLPESAQWSVPLFLRLPAGIAAESVRYALRAAVERHESLRACFAVDGTQIQRTVTNDGEAEFRIVELGLPELADEIGRELRLRFDLEHGPLLRALLCLLPGVAPVLFVVIHRIAADVTPPAVLRRELAEFCAARHENRLPVLSAPDTYPEPVVEQSWTVQDIEYWCERLAGLPPVNLPLDRPRPPRWDGRGSAVRFSLTALISDETARTARRSGTTVSAVLLTTLASVIGRYTGQWAMAIGSSACHAAHPAVQPIRLDRSMTFWAALQALHGMQESAAAHPFPPFDLLTERLAPERDLSRPPVYQVAFEMMDASTGAVAGPGAQADECITALAFEVTWGIAHTDLAMSVCRSPGGSLSGVLGYPVALFDESTVRRFSDHFQRFLSAALRDPHRVLADVGMLSDAERHQVSAGWPGAADVRDLRLPTVVEQFEACAARSPAARAVAVSDGGAICYGELDSRADHLAARLSELGAGPGENVGVLLNRGIDMVACLLAVGKTGAAYLPMDPDLPIGRLGGMLDDSGARVVLTDSACVAKVTGFGGAYVVVDADPVIVAPGPAARPAPAPNPDDAAYVIYTSGSTGRPKAVQVTHRSLANYVHWAATNLVRDGSCGAALFSSVAFDLVVTTLWTPLVTGRTLFVVAQHGLPADFDAIVPVGERLSFLKMTPGQLEILRAQLGEERVAALADYLVVAGEPLPGPTANRWLDVLGPGRLINSYGPTEATVATCVYPVTSHVREEVTPIGRPLPNVSAFVLDPALRPVPIGVVGELYAGGVGVARGYLGQPQLTAERFIPDLFGPPGSRLYRTGDLARWLTTGDLAFAGRVDDQVKILGYRVEPGEVASVIAGCPGIADAAVLIVGTRGSDRRLAAFYTLDNRSRPTAGAVHTVAAHCAANLPAYMVPAEYQAVPELPRTANGKIDRPALTEVWGGTRVRRRRPRTALEEQIAAVWAALVGTEPDLDTDFFAVGGNSVLAVHFSSVLSDALGASVPPWALFGAPTVERLAAVLEDAAPADPPPENGTAGEAQQLISILFEDVLAVRNVGPDDSFFAIGGDSIRAFKLLNAAQQQGIAFELADLYELHTPRNLAKVAVRKAPTVLTEAAEREFWRDYLAGYDGDPRLFTDRADMNGSIRGLGSVTVGCGIELCRRLDAVREAGDGGLPVLFHAAAAVLTAKLGQYGDVVLGTSAAEQGRDRGEPVPLRCTVDPAVTVAEFLDAVRDGMRRVSRHCLLSLQEISDVAGIRQPLQVLVTTGDLLAHENDHFDLFLELADLSPPRVTVRYETTLFTRATAGRLADAAFRLMDFFVTRPHDRLRQAPLLADHDRRALRALWSDVAGPTIQFGEAAIGALITAPAWPEFVGQAEQRGLLSVLLLAL